MKSFKMIAYERKKFAFLALSLCATLALAADMKVYKSPTCGCCGNWVSAMQKAGFSEETIKVDDMVKVKKEFHVPLELSSCHTAIVDGYVIDKEAQQFEEKDTFFDAALAEELQGFQQSRGFVPNGEISEATLKILREAKKYLKLLEYKK